MLFSSLIFLLCFFPAVLILYYVFKFSRVAQNCILLIFSLIFYAWGEPVFVFVMIGSIAANYGFGFLVPQKKRASKLFLVISIAFNITILFIAKYLNFAVENINSSGIASLDVAYIALPIGISFFTFQAMSYVIDVYRGNSATQRNPFYLALYISFFPQLIAGPIVRYNTIEDQIRNRKESLKKISVGSTRFLTGLLKKILIANNMAIVADHIYSMTGQPAALAWLGSFAYTLQIFFDFSAYSDMAIGLGLIFGFEFRENFNYPYISKSISEFWRRWHISLGEWFRDYVYFPLGGSKVKNTDRMVFNLLVVWMLTGIWHGANWTFFAWGLLNFVFIAFEKLTNFAKNNKLNILKHIYTLIVVNFGWVLFRSESLLAAGKYFESMFGVNGLWSDYTWMFIKEFWVFFAAGIIFSTPVAKRLSYLWVKSDSKLIKYSVGSASVVIYPVLAALLFLICMSYLVKGSYNPFIYFNF